VLFPEPVPPETPITTGLLIVYPPQYKAHQRKFIYLATL